MSDQLSAPDAAVVAGATPSAATGTALRVVFDTNILLSLYAFSDSRFRALRKAIEDGRIVALTRDDCLKEFARVLGYRSIRASPERRAEAYAAYAAIAQLVGPPPNPARRLPRCKDKDDQMFLEVARDGAAQYLVTLDGCLLGLAQKMRAPGDAAIVVPQRLLALVEATAAA